MRISFLCCIKLKPRKFIFNLFISFFCIHSRCIFISSVCLIWKFAIFQFKFYHPRLFSSCVQLKDVILSQLWGIFVFLSFYLFFLCFGLINKFIQRTIQRCYSNLEKMESMMVFDSKGLHFSFKNNEEIWLLMFSTFFVKWVGVKRRHLFLIVLHFPEAYFPLKQLYFTMVVSWLFHIDEEAKSESKTVTSVHSTALLLSNTVYDKWSARGATHFSDRISKTE